MLMRYAVKNFQSFKDLTEVSLELNRKVQRHGWEARTKAGQRLATVMAVIGPNGAGKTALLKPIVFSAWFIAHSFHAKADARIPIIPHFGTANRPTELEIDAEGDDGRIWRYVIHATPERVMHEALYQKQDRFKYVFVRDWDESLDGYVIKQQDFDFSPKEARKVRPNASLISTAAQYGVEIARYVASNHIQSNIGHVGRLPFRPEMELPNAARHFAANEEQRAAMVRLLKSWDLGLSDVQLRELATQTAGEPAQKIWYPVGVHSGSSKARHELLFHDESSGTQAAFVLLSRLLDTLAAGGLAIIDELESGLHPHMLEPILDLFANRATNPHDAVLLFTTHSIEVLNLLHKSQVMLVEKNEKCESVALRMDSIQGIRNDDDFYSKYMAGAYGAIPRV